MTIERQGLNSRGNSLTLDYDELQRVVAETWYDNATDADAQQNARNTVTYAYDIVSRTAGVADDYYDYTYDNRDRLTGVTSNNDGMPTVVLTIGYDRLDDLRTSLSATIDGTDDFVNTYIYDDLLRLTQIKQTGQSGGNTVADKRVTYAYLPDGQLDTTTRHADTDSDGQIDDLVATTSHTYDDAGRLTDLVHAQGSTQIADYDWTFDAAGRITQFLHTDYTDTDHTSTYTYDDAGQLTAADHDTQDDETYTYDDNGNRTIHSLSRARWIRAKATGSVLPSATVPASSILVIRIAISLSCIALHTHEAMRPHRHQGNY